jgi:signal transduction histidine kinase
MTNEITRLQQTSRRMMLVWLVVAFCSLTYCLFGVFSEQPQMLHSWKGGALLLLVGIFVLWYITWYWRFARPRPPTQRDWPPPWRWALRQWAGVYLLIGLMAALHPLMGWLFWCAFGMAFGMFKPPWVLIPVCLSSLGIFYALFVTSNPPPDAIIWMILSMSLALLSVGYSVYLMTRLLHQRYEREHVFLELEDAHRQLAEAHRQLERSAERDAELAVLSERNRLAREMHDTIGHALVLIAVKLEAAQRLRAVNPERADHEIEVTKGVVRTTMSELRASLADLRAPTSEQCSLGETLARRAREGGERAGFSVSVDLQPDLMELSQPLYETLYRVGAEALTNIEKHAHASNITLSLAQQAEMLVLRIEDDGVGLPALVTSGSRAAGNAPADTPTRPSSPPGHYGITGMRERVEALGGTLTLNTRPGGGTIVEAATPSGAH